MSVELTLAGRRRRVFCKRDRLPSMKRKPRPEINIYLSPAMLRPAGRLPSCSAALLFLNSCLLEMPTEPVLLPSQLCSDCGQWSARFYLLCQRHNQNSLRPVSSLSPKPYFSPTFRALLLLPPPLTCLLLWMKREGLKEGEKRERERESQMMTISSTSC